MTGRDRDRRPGARARDPDQHHRRQQERHNDKQEAARHQSPPLAIISLLRHSSTCSPHGRGQTLPSNTHLAAVGGRARRLGRLASVSRDDPWRGADESQKVPIALREAVAARQARSPARSELSAGRGNRSGHVDRLAYPWAVTPKPSWADQPQHPISEGGPWAPSCFTAGSSAGRRCQLGRGRYSPIKKAARIKASPIRASAVLRNQRSRYVTTASLIEKRLCFSSRWRCGGGAERP